MRILITGVAGFIGYSLANELLKNKKTLYSVSIILVSTQVVI